MYAHMSLNAQAIILEGVYVGMCLSPLAFLFFSKESLSKLTQKLSSVAET